MKMQIKRGYPEVLMGGSFYLYNQQKISKNQTKKILKQILNVLGEQTGELPDGATADGRSFFIAAKNTLFILPFKVI